MEELQSAEEGNAYAEVGTGSWGSGYVWRQVYRISMYARVCGTEGHRVDRNFW
jgi:hypothetical protein